MNDKLTRREALKGLLLAGMGLAVGGPLLHGADRDVHPTGLQDPAPWKEAPEGTKIDSRKWDKMGETLGMLGLGCMRLPTLSGGGGGYGRRQPLDQNAVNAMVDYAIAHGVNYFDTAPAYGESEVVTGKALSRHPRSSYKIATKISNMNGRPTLEAGKQMFETSLKNLQVDYVDFLLLHNLQNLSGFNTRFKDNGLFEWLLEQKKKGRIKHLGFSFHGSNDDLPKLTELYDWDFVQIQLNYKLRVPLQPSRRQGHPRPGDGTRKGRRTGKRQRRYSGSLEGAPSRPDSGSQRTDLRRLAARRNGDA